ncbi:MULTISPECIES: nitroreductase family deazaflavin-dependent oxidoreductase [unclassified Streptomyces]|uniref:nitroreductase family deazaflavin-dependent oxidoreductase n=1 Tax=unclassified Streptomyces TaxID=2593676 RepID=UPI0037F910AB
MTDPSADSSGPRPPAPRDGWRRTLARLPVHMFRAGLGPLFRGRLLLLVHTGHTSGQPRRTAVEVVESATVDGRLSWTVASGSGPGADWYRDLRRTPQATVQIGRRFHAVTAAELPAREGGELMVRCAPRRPRLARRLCAHLGFTVDGSAEGRRDAGESIAFVRLTEGAPVGGGDR